MGSDPIVSRTPSSSLLSLPCADAQGWKSTSLDNARKFRMKFTVADPSFHFVIFSQCRLREQPPMTSMAKSSSAPGSALAHSGSCAMSEYEKLLPIARTLSGRERSLANVVEATANIAQARTTAMLNLFRILISLPFLIQIHSYFAQKRKKSAVSFWHVVRTTTLSSERETTAKSASPSIFMRPMPGTDTANRNVTGYLSGSW